MVALVLLDGTYGIARFEPEAAIPEWAGGPGFVSMTRTPDELSIVCRDDRIPDDATAERGWRMFRVRGQLDFSLTGIVHSLTGPLAEAAISVFVLSTYDTDYLAVPGAAWSRATDVWRETGHRVDTGQGTSDDAASHHPEG